MKTKKENNMKFINFFFQKALIPDESKEKFLKFSALLLWDYFVMLQAEKFSNAHHPPESPAPRPPAPRRSRRASRCKPKTPGWKSCAKA
jgi:hypothetical protein